MGLLTMEREEMAHAAHSPLRRWAAQALEAIWLAAAVAVPLAFNPWGGSGFELPKAVLLRVMVLLMILAALVRAVETWGGPGRSPPCHPAIPLLVASSTPGHAMKAAPNPPVGTVVGKALEPLDDNTGVIQILVMLQ